MLLEKPIPIGYIFRKVRADALNVLVIGGVVEWLVHYLRPRARQALRGLDRKVGAVEHLATEDVADAERHSNKPLALMQQHARDPRCLASEQAVTDLQRVAIDETLTRLVDSMGRAEAMTSIARTIELNLRETLGHADVPAPLASSDFSAM